jgi:O-antigen ligase
MAFTIVSSLAAFVAGVAVVFGLALAVHVASWRRQSFITYLGPVIFMTLAVTTLASERDFAFLREYDTTAASRPAVVAWFSRFASLFLVVAATERIIRRVIAPAVAGPRVPGSAAVLLAAFLLMWVTTVVLPALWGAVPHFGHEYFYTALIGAAVLLVSRSESQRAVELVRNAAMVFLLAGVLVTPAMPWLTVDTHYSQGYVPGLPRYAGLAAHAVSLGMLSLVGLLCLWSRPYASGWLTRLGWLLGISVLVMTQSKAAWIALLVCAAAVAVVRWGRTVLQWAGDRPNAAAVAAALVLVAAIAAATSGAVAFGDVGARIGAFLVASQEGAQLMTMTGRDQIWEVALQEWARHPIFGYGPLMFDFDYRVGIDMRQATHGHNQVVDTLARSGLVGLGGLTLYVAVLAYYAVKFAAATRGLTLALMLLLILRSVSEVPYDVFGYSPENIPHFTLLLAIAGQFRARRVEAAAAPPYGRVQPYLYAPRRT